MLCLICENHADWICSNAIDYLDRLNRPSSLENLQLYIDLVTRDMPLCCNNIVGAPKPVLNSRSSIHPSI